ncbi:MAG: hypothetical protein EKK55_22480 [Rhodocyclaceae bacterium]|nr:MAG: hypothetical protein EKK55_22480 [Rhodocyclaceae bacterium]
MNEQEEIDKGLTAQISMIISLCSESATYFIPQVENHIEIIKDEFLKNENINPQRQESAKRAEMRAVAFLKFLITLRDTELEKLQEGKSS